MSAGHPVRVPDVKRTRYGHVRSNTPCGEIPSARGHDPARDPSCGCSGRLTLFPADLYEVGDVSVQLLNVFCVGVADLARQRVKRLVATLPTPENHSAASGASTSPWNSAAVKGVRQAEWQAV